jgi:histone chaperone ASF1
MKAAPPDKIQFDKLVRDISTKLRVTRFQIKWSVILTYYSCLISLFSFVQRDVVPQSQGLPAAGAAASAAVPSANDLDGEESNGIIP